jgi:hypothetical protein
MKGLVRPPNPQLFNERIHQFFAAPAHHKFRAASKLDAPLPSP